MRQTFVNLIRTISQDGMLYSAESLKTIDAIKDGLGQELKRRAIDIAKQDGRNLVTNDDVLVALNNIDQETNNGV